MNKKQKFGYDTLGMYTTIKLNVCLTQRDLEVLEVTYKEWLSFCPGYKGRIRIEGILPTESHSQFITNLGLALTRTKIDKLKEKESRLVAQYLSIDRTIPNFNDNNVI